MKKAVTQPGQASSPKLGKRSVRRVLILSIVLVVALVPVGWRIVLTRISRSERMPVELVGTWRSDDARYRGRYLFINEREIGFRSVEEGWDDYQVFAVNSRDTDDGRAGEPERVLSVTIDVERRRIRLSGRGNVEWQRAGG